MVAAVAVVGAGGRLSRAGVGGGDCDETTALDSVVLLLLLLLARGGRLRRAGVGGGDCDETTALD